MPNFHYRALTQSGELVSGSIAARARVGHSEGPTGRGRTVMAEQRFGSAREQGSGLVGQLDRAGVKDRVDAGVVADQAPAAHAPVHGMAINPRRQQLPSRDAAPLHRADRRDPLVAAVRSSPRSADRRGPLIAAVR